jgi:hypothetical protein
MEVLALCQDQLPSDVPPPQKGPADRMRVRHPGGSAGDQRTPGQ